MCDRLQGIPGVEAEIAFPTQGPRPLCIPRVRLRIDEESAPASLAKIVAELGMGRPAVAVYAEPERAAIWLNPQHLREGEEQIVAQRLKEILEEA